MNAPKVLVLNVDALLISFIFMLMLLILSLPQERSDKNLVGMKLRDSVFWKWNLIIENVNAGDVIYSFLSLSHE